MFQKTIFVLHRIFAGKRKCENNEEKDSVSGGVSGNGSVVF
jgi:hypothetical protein